MLASECFILLKCLSCVKFSGECQALNLPFPGTSPSRRWRLCRPFSMPEFAALARKRSRSGSQVEALSRRLNNKGRLESTTLAFLRVGKLSFVLAACFCHSPFPLQGRTDNVNYSGTILLRAIQPLSQGERPQKLTSGPPKPDLSALAGATAGPGRGLRLRRVRER